MLVLLFVIVRVGCLEEKKGKKPKIKLVRVRMATSNTTLVRYYKGACGTQPYSRLPRILFRGRLN